MGRAGRWAERRKKKGRRRIGGLGLLGGEREIFSLFSNLDFTLTMEANKELGCGLAI